MSLSLPQKVLQYEEFLNERLRSDLHKVLSQQEQVYGEMTEYDQLKTTLELLISEGLGTPGKTLKTMVDLGCNFYARAKVQDCSKIFVSIGLGFHLEMELGEASAFIEKKVSHLMAKADRLSEQVSQINGRIKLLMETLRELQFSSPPHAQPREVW